jgi:hypothetical protein
MPSITNGKLVWTVHNYFVPAADGTITAGANWLETTWKDRLAKINALHPNTTLNVTEWNIRNLNPQSAVQYKYFIDKCKANNWPHCLFTFDGAISEHTCFDANYDELPRKNWTALMTAMGRTTVGAPK